MKTKMTLLLMIFFCSLSTWANEKSSIKEEMNEKLLISSYEAPEPTVDLLTQPIQLAQPTKYKVEFINLGNAKNKPQPQNIIHGGQVKKPYPDPSSESLDFQGWKKVISGNKTESDFYNFNRQVSNSFELRAEWTFKKYSVTFNTKGVNPIPDKQIVYHGDKAKKPKNPIYYGHTFQHWTHNGKKFDFNTPITGPTELVVVWKKLPVYTVTFTSKTGKHLPGPQQVVEGYKAKNTPQKPVRDGYDFAYWAYKGKEFDFDTRIYNNIELVAVWKDIPVFTVTFKSKSGKPLPPPQKVARGSTAKEPTVKPKWEGYDFNYWTQEDGKQFNFYTPITRNMELIPSWTPLTYTVTFDANGGEPKPKDQKVEHGKFAKEPTTKPKMDGYGFLHWAHKGKIFDFTKPITENIELVVIWTKLPVYTVKFTCKHGGSPLPPDQKVYKENKATKPTIIPKRECCAFNHWRLNDKKFDFNTPINKNIVLVAAWGLKIPTTYTVTFDADGGTPTPTKQDVKKGKVATKPTDPKKEGFVFKGWMLTDGTSFKFETPITKDITLKAKWEKEAVTPPSTKTHTITFDADGGTPKSTKKVVTNGDVVNPPVSPKKDGYKFTGWIKGGVYYDFDTPVKNSFTLTAAWELITSNINISADKEVHYYPNPVKNNLYLTCEEGIKEIHLFNVNGQCLRHLTPNEQTNVTVEMGTLNAGFYLIKVTTPKGITTLKVIKQ